MLGNITLDIRDVTILAVHFCPLHYCFMYNVFRQSLCVFQEDGISGRKLIRNIFNQRSVFCAAFGFITVISLQVTGVLYTVIRFGLYAPHSNTLNKKHPLEVQVIVMPSKEINRLAQKSPSSRFLQFNCLKETSAPRHFIFEDQCRFCGYNAIQNKCIQAGMRALG